MKHKILFLPILLALLLTACGTAQATPEPTPIPVVEADDTIIAEGRLEPATFTEISLNASGLISDLPVEEGDKVSAGDVLAVVESENAQTLEDARAKAVQELTAAYQEYRDTQSRLDDFDVPTRWGGMTPTDAIADTLGK
ncbi:MAG: biotin/lipoyl-binding protein [Chloroflexi bacterium]|nr:biotin/lipoyl-binding protein [Chloroflexota bacterium]